MSFTNKRRNAPGFRFGRLGAFCINIVERIVNRVDEILSEKLYDEREETGRPRKVSRKTFGGQP